MKHMRRQSGFGAIEALMILLAVILLVAGGWYVYKTQSKTDTPKQASHSDAKKSETPATKKYFESPELGVKFELSEELQQANLVSTYEVSQSYYGAQFRNGASTEAKSLSFSTKDIQDSTASIDKDCYGVTPGVIASITRYDGDHQSTHGNVDDHQHFDAVYPFDGFHLISMGETYKSIMQDVCGAHTSQELKDKATKLELLLLEAFKTTTAL